MKRLLFLSLLLVSPLHAQTWSPMPVDYVITMNTSTPGTALTSAIFTAGSMLNPEMSFSSVSIGQGFTVGADQTVCSNLGPVAVNGGSTLPANSLNYNNVALNDQFNINSDGYVTMNVGGAAHGKTVLSMTGCIYLGPPSVPNSGGGTGSDWDRYTMWASNGEYGDIQVAQGGGCSQFTPALPSGYVCIRAEGKPTSHSGYFYVLPQHAYWMSLWWNDSNTTVDGWPAGTQLLHVYATDGTPIPCATTVSTSAGCTTLTANGVIAADIIPNQTAVLSVCGGANCDNGSGLNKFTFGNFENGGNTGTTSYYQNLMFNYTTGQFPLFWASGTTGTQPQPPTNVKATAQ